MNSGNTASQAGNITNHPAHPPVTYDVPAIFEFLDFVFHDTFHEDEHVLVWATENSVAYPITEEALEKKLTRTRKGFACYYSTATVTPAENGKLFNRKANFKRLHVIVLDDVGTKVSLDKLNGIEPSYVIETSEGNYQWGFVLDKPIENYAVAEALINAVYTSGLTDGGGKLVGKVVRLPCGINGKKDPAKGRHLVTLVGGLSRRYSPQELIQTLKLDLEWNDLVRNPSRAIKNSLTRAGYIAQWSPLADRGASLTGYTDPVLAWLYDRKMVRQETDNWVTIRCPWGHAHSTGDDTSGYSPAGWGDAPTFRSWHCFHDHCAGRTFEDFAEWVQVQGGPQVPRDELDLELAERYVLDPISQGAWQLRPDKAPVFTAIAGMRLRYPHTHFTAVAGDGGSKLMKEGQVQRWLRSENRVTVEEVTSDPRYDYRVFDTDNGLVLNLYHRPTWFNATAESSHINRFMEFITFLIPDERDHTYFLDWLSMKIRKPSYRGPAFIFSSPNVFGTGRGRLTLILRALFGDYNTENTSLDKLLNDSYAEWQGKLLVVIDETLSDANPNAWRTYETLKDYVDPDGKHMIVNPKYRPRHEVYCCASFIFYSNHLHTLPIPEGDRRFYPALSATKPRAPEYYTELMAWINEGSWVGPVWRWLHDRELSADFRPYAPPPASSVKDVMAKRSATPVSRAVRLIAEALALRDILVVPVEYINHEIRHNLTRVIDISESQMSSLRHTLAETFVQPASEADRSRLRLGLNGKRIRCAVNMRHGVMLDCKTTVSNVVDSKNYRTHREKAQTFFAKPEKLRAVIDEIATEMKSEGY